MGICLSKEEKLKKEQEKLAKQTQHWSQFPQEENHNEEKKEASTTESKKEEKRESSIKDQPMTIKMVAVETAKSQTSTVAIVDNKSHLPNLPHTSSLSSSSNLPPTTCFNSWFNWKLPRLSVSPSSSTHGSTKTKTKVAPIADLEKARGQRQSLEYPNSNTMSKPAEPSVPASPSLVSFPSVSSLRGWKVFSRRGSNGSLPSCKSPPPSPESKLRFSSAPVPLTQAIAATTKATGLIDKIEAREAPKAITATTITTTSSSCGTSSVPPPLPPLLKKQSFVALLQAQMNQSLASQSLSTSPSSYSLSGSSFVISSPSSSSLCSSSRRSTHSSALSTNFSVSLASSSASPPPPLYPHSLPPFPLSSLTQPMQPTQAVTTINLLQSERSDAPALDHTTNATISKLSSVPTEKQDVENIQSLHLLPGQLLADAELEKKEESNKKEQMDSKKPKESEEPNEKQEIFLETKLHQQRMESIATEPLQPECVARDDSNNEDFEDMQETDLDSHEFPTTIECFKNNPENNGGTDSKWEFWKTIPEHPKGPLVSLPSLQVEGERFSDDDDMWEICDTEDDLTLPQQMP